MSSTAVRPDAPPGHRSEVSIRAATPADAEAAARIVYEAFARIDDRHRFPRDFPTLEAAPSCRTPSSPTPPSGASSPSATAGSSARTSSTSARRSPGSGRSPSSRGAGAGVGRRLMQAVIERGAGAAGIRLLQDSFNTGSLALYASLGFEVEEPAALMGGRPRIAPPDHVEVRPLEPGDLQECERLRRAVHGYERTRELRDALDAPGLTPFVRAATAASSPTRRRSRTSRAAYAVAETERDMTALVAGALAAPTAPASFLLPTRQHELFRWCLDSGLRVVKPMTYMAIGDHRRPNGAWIPSVLS